VVLAVPVGFFDVIILRNAQMEAPSDPAVSQNLSTACGRHAGTETMHARTAADFGLVRSFRHSEIPILLKNDCES
jgi:hypothetical protein